MIGPDTLVRPLQPDDTQRLHRLFARLSPETVVRRFFTLMPKLTDPLVRILTRVDHDIHEALVVIVADEIVALASYHRSPTDPSVADVAVLVEDAWQHHNIGHRLMGQLTELARSRGITTFHADVLSDNRAAAGLITRMNRTAKPVWDGELLSYNLPIRAA
jgi:GNAT superfamily N-acetyltransferase